MQRFFLLLFLGLVPALAIAFSPGLQMVQVTAITDQPLHALSLDILHSSGNRSRAKMAGIRTSPRYPAYHQAAKKRLHVLAMGKTLQMQVHPQQYAAFFYGGQNLAERLLKEGLVLIDPHSLQWFNMHQQQQLIEAAEHAQQNRLGVWSELWVR